MSFLSCTQTSTKGLKKMFFLLKWHILSPMESHAYSGIMKSHFIGYSRDLGRRKRQSRNYSVNHFFRSLLEYRWILWEAMSSSCLENLLSSSNSNIKNLINTTLWISEVSIMQDSALLASSLWSPPKTCSTSSTLLPSKQKKWWKHMEKLKVFISMIQLCILCWEIKLIKQLRLYHCKFIMKDMGSIAKSRSTKWKLMRLCIWIGDFW